MKGLKYHIFGALIYSAWTLGLDVFYSRSSIRWPLELMALADNIWIFYSGYATLYFFFLRRGRQKLYGILVATGSLTGCYLINYLYYKVVHVHYDPAIYGSRQILYVASQEYTYFFIYSIGYLFLTRFIQKQKELRQFEKKSAFLQREKLTLEKDLLVTENNFLRAQISPHFLYNCLNFFYSEVFERQPKTADAILLLAKIMRYSLSDFTANKGLAELQAEVDHLRDVIEMHQLRYGYSLHIVLTCEGNAAGKLIAPMILITMVENVLKHGDLHDDSAPALIRCRVDARQHLLLFSTENKKAKGRPTVSSGIGINNMRQRLMKIYGDSFRLDIKEDASFYREELSMPYFDDLSPAQPISKPSNYSYAELPDH